MKNHNVKIYQLPIECDFCFKGYNKDEFDFSKYEKVYDGEVGLNEEEYKESMLEEIFSIFNCDIPEDYSGRSLSVSDVVCFDGEYYYCDIIGWQRVEGC